ncbi:MAG: terminase small subunit [Proteobacteria bacterium]|nr:terminase small subunit [Pseudomonadota bacterium]
MTPKQKRFVEEYLVDLNAAAAARRAGYAKGSAWRLMRHRAVAAAIEEAQEQRAQRTRVSADRVITEIAKVAFGDPRRLFSWGPGGVELRESSELTEAEAALVSEVSETRTAAGGTRRIKLHCKMTALTALAKHLGLFGNGRKAALLRAAAQNGGTDNGEVEHGESGPADDARERLARRIAGLAARLGTRDPDRGAE